MKYIDEALSSLDVTRLKKAKLWSMIVLVGVAIIVIVVVGRPKPPAFVKKIPQNLIQVKAHQDDFQHWASAYETEIASLKERGKVVGEGLYQTHAEIKQMSEHLIEQEKLYRDLSKQMREIAQRVQTGLAQQVVADKQIATPTRAGRLALFATSIPVKETLPVKPTPVGTAPQEPTNKTHLGWLPVGSFFTATLLNGIDAGTGTHAQANPQPVLVRVDSQAFLPNQARYRVRACFVLGSAYGSLPSERALVRTARISCVSQDGKAIIDSELKGYVVDMDGKLGLRGKLINRQGSKLAKAMLAGFFGGLSNVAAQFKQVATQAAGGAASAVTPQASLQLAGISGVDNVTKELTHFYINEAKRLFPVIEVNAGRHVVINVSSGVGLRWQPVTKSGLLHIDE